MTQPQARPRTIRRLAKPAAVVAAGLVGLGLTWLLGLLPLLANLEDRTVDIRLRFRLADPGFGREVAVVLIDDAALAKYPYRSPVPRDLLARLIDAVGQAGPRSIGLDVFLKEPSWPEPDQALAQALARSGRTILVATLRDENARLSLDLPHPLFLDAALGVGLADLPVDPADQVVRRFIPAYQAQGQTLPAMSAALAAAAQGAVQDKIPRAGPVLAERPGLRLDQAGAVRINYQGPPSTFGGQGQVIKTFPASAVLTGLLPPDWFKDKYVLIGAGYADNTDSYRTPFYAGRFDYALTPGVEIHANALATLLAGQSLEPLGPAGAWAILAILAGLVLILEWRFKPLLTAALGLAVGLAYAALTFLLLERFGLVAPLVPAALALSLSFMAATVLRSLTEGRQRRWINQAFGRYVSPELVELLVTHPERLVLGGEERELTIMFTDIQGFTTISESLTPPQLVQILNAYLDGMTRILLSRQGTLDKYEGDAIVAFWNAPLETPGHPQAAAACALEMAAFAEEMSQRLAAQGGPRLRTRIGLNTGRVVVGNIGSGRRFNYTIIGDEANLAARLEGANKKFGTQIMLSQATAERVGSDFVLRELGGLVVKGKTRPIKVYELLGPRDDQGAVASWLTEYHNGLTAFQGRRFELAVQYLEAGLRLRPEDGAARLYLEWSRRLLASPPPAEWTGVLTLDEK